MGRRVSRHRKGAALNFYSPESHDLNGPARLIGVDSLRITIQVPRDVLKQTAARSGNFEIVVFLMGLGRRRPGLGGSPALDIETEARDHQAGDDQEKPCVLLQPTRQNYGYGQKDAS